MDNVPNMAADTGAGIKTPVVPSAKQAVKGRPLKGKSAGFSDALRTTIKAKDGDTKDDRRDQSTPADNHDQQTLLKGFTTGPVTAFLAVQLPQQLDQAGLTGTAKEGALALSLTGIQPETATSPDRQSLPQLNTFAAAGESAKESGAADTTTGLNSSNAMAVASSRSQLTKTAADQALIANSNTGSQILPDASQAGQKLLSDTVPQTTQSGQLIVQPAGETVQNTAAVPLQEIMTTAAQTTGTAVPADYQMKSSQIASVFKASTEQQPASSDSLLQTGASEVSSDASAVNPAAASVKTAVTAQAGSDMNDGNGSALNQQQNQSAKDSLLLGDDKKSSDVPLSFSSLAATNQEPVVNGANHSQAAANTPKAPPDLYNVLPQIVDHARLIKTPERSEMVIQLKPEHLGELTLRVSVDGGTVNASFHSNNAEVRSIIESSLVQLRQDMAGQGLKVDNVGVYAGLGNLFSDGQQRSPQQNGGKPASSNRKADSNDFIQAVESVEAPAQSETASGVDYKV